MEMNNKQNASMESASTSQTAGQNPSSPMRPRPIRPPSGPAVRPAVQATRGAPQNPPGPGAPRNSGPAAYPAVQASGSLGLYAGSAIQYPTTQPNWFTSLCDRFDHDLHITSLAIKDISWRVSQLISDQEMNVVIKSHRLYELQKENESYLLKCTQLQETAKLLGNLPHGQISYEISIVNYQAHLSNRSIAIEQERLEKIIESYRVPMGC